MSWKIFIAGIMVATFAGCAVQPVAKINLSTKFDKEEAQKLLKDGPNTIKGSALIRQAGGGVVTCAGREVRLVPATAYASERIGYIYNNGSSGFAPAYKQTQFSENETDYFVNVKNSMCDAQGYFKFEKVADGEFYVLTNILWRVNQYNNEGGALMRKVKVNAGEIKEVVLAP
jgi:hypothetical protein